MSDAATMDSKPKVPYQASWRLLIISGLVGGAVTLWSIHRDNVKDEASRLMAKNIIGCVRAERNTSQLPVDQQVPVRFLRGSFSVFPPLSDANTATPVFTYDIRLNRIGLADEAYRPIATIFGNCGVKAGLPQADIAK